MTKEQEQETFNERKSHKLQRELEESYVPVSKITKVSLINKILRVIGRYFGLE